MPAACTRLAVTSSGELIHRRVSSGTGQTVSMPASGSRMMPLTNEDAAALAGPGRTATVAKRQDIPSTNPFLEYSCTRSSTIAFSEPYDDWGTTAMSSGTMAGREPPKTASVLVKTKRGGFLSGRHASRSAQVASTLTRMPRSNSASA
jgi:hypothetical protein